MSGEGKNKETTSDDCENKFQLGEEVLCYYGKCIYKAKCEEIKSSGRNKEYFVHYCGWNKKWDEWVSEDRLLKYNEENLKKQKFLEQSISAGKKAKTKPKKRKLDSVLNSSAEESAAKRPKPEPKKKREYSRTKNLPKQKARSQLQNDSSASSSSQDKDFVKEGNHSKETKSMLTIPSELEKRLLHDYEALTEHKKLVVIPAKKTVDQILKEYFAFKMSSKGYVPNNDLLDYYAGMQEYFNVLLPKQLLYGFERLQHAEIAKSYPNMSLTELYGIIHLLRLFVKLQSVIPSFDDESRHFLLTYTQDFLKFIKNNSDSLFSLQDYSKPPQQYSRKAIRFMKKNK